MNRPGPPRRRFLGPLISLLLLLALTLVGPPAHAAEQAVSFSLNQAEVIDGRLRRLGTATFPTLVADAGERTVVVARFLALLELAREALLEITQAAEYAPLYVRLVPAGSAP